MKFTIVGAGRAGSSFAAALRRAGHDVRLIHHDQLEEVGAPDVVLLSVPDDAISEVAQRLDPGSYVVAHVAGSRGLAEVVGHARTGFLHPLAVLPNEEVGSRRLVGALYSVGGDPLVDDIVASLGGRAVRLSDDQRVLYHATASVAANHLVALLGHVAALAEAAGLALDDFLTLAEQSLSDVASMGVHQALTGPASRADMATIDAHLAALPESERATYVALANAAFELAERRRSGAPV